MRLADNGAPGSRDGGLHSVVRILPLACWPLDVSFTTSLDHTFCNQVASQRTIGIRSNKRLECPVRSTLHTGCEKFPLGTRKHAQALRLFLQGGRNILAVPNGCFDSQRSKPKNMTQLLGLASHRLEVDVIRGPYHMGSMRRWEGSLWMF